MPTVALAVVAFGTLLAAGLLHAAEPSSLARGIGQLGLPRAPSLVVAITVATLEALIGGLGLMREVLDVGPSRAFVTVAAIVLYAAFTLYQLAAARRIKGAVCACGGASLPISRWTIARSSALAVIAGAVLLGDSIATMSTQIVAGAALGVAIWTLPQAMTYTTGVNP